MQKLHRTKLLPNTEIKNMPVNVKATLQQQMTLLSVLFYVGLLDLRCRGLFLREMPNVCSTCK